MERSDSNEFVVGWDSLSTFPRICGDGENILTRLALAVGIVLVALVVGTTPARAGQSAPRRHVVVMVWDGMRPDFVSETHTPTLYRLVQQGVEFEDHHPSYLSLTEGNGSVLATGVYPERVGVLADTEYRPAVDPLAPVHTEDLTVVRKGDTLTRGHYLAVPTLVEILQKARYRTVVAGSKGVVLLADRSERKSCATGTTLFAGQTLPPSLLDAITNFGGPFPGLQSTQPSRDDWTTSALLNSLWRDGVPGFTLLWLNQPDLIQHQTGPGSEQSLAAIRTADYNLARVLQDLDARGVRDSTDIMVVSDHGFSTVSAMVDLADSLILAGLNARRAFDSPPSRGDVMVVGNAGSALIYVIGHDENVIHKVVDFLQGWKCTGVIFSKKAMPGTFTLAQVHEDSPIAPDVIVSLRWTADKNDDGTPGMAFSDLSEYGAGQGMHASLSRYDMHNMLIAAGPDFRSGIVDHLPTGNMDIAPTVLWMLGVNPPKAMDGRVLTEALKIAGPKIKSYEPGHLEAEAPIQGGAWHQYLNFTEVNGVNYYDEGNGSQTGNPSRPDSLAGRSDWSDDRGRQKNQGIQRD